MGASSRLLGDLENFRGEYQAQWVERGSQGVTGQWLRNYQYFLGQLETAVGQQRQSLPQMACMADPD